MENKLRFTPFYYITVINNQCTIGAIHFLPVGVGALDDPKTKL